MTPRLTSQPGPSRRGIVPAGLALALVLALTVSLLAACGGGGGGAAVEDPPPAGRDGTLAVSQPGQMLDEVRRLLRERAARRGGGGMMFADAPSIAPALAVAGGAAAPAELIRSDTAVQEAGVGEHDLIKSDGDWIYTLDTATQAQGGTPLPRVSAWRRRADGSLAAPVRQPLPAAEGQSPVVHGLQLAPGARRLAVLGESVGSLPWGDPCVGDPRCLTPMALPAIGVGTSEVTLHLLDLAADGTPGTATRIAFDGRLLSTRLLGNLLVVVSHHAPRLALDDMPAGAARDAALAALTTADVLPRLRIGSEPARALVNDTDCWLQPANASLAVELTTITLIDLAQPQTAPRSRCFLGGSEALMMTTGQLYLATTRHAAQPVDVGGGVVAWRQSATAETDIHKFALDGGQVRYRASGRVPGHLGWDVDRKSYRMSEHDGLLRVLSFTGESGWARAEDASRLAASPATLSVLRENEADARLELLATLPNAQRPQPLGHDGEQVYAVRFIGTRGYVVTFRRTDPLYVLDLSDPADPRIAGELQVPGFSDQLYPLDGGMLLGVGKDADANGMVTGLKVSLFDVADAARPAELASLRLGGPGSTSALDSSAHGLNLLGVDGVVRAALPVVLAPQASDSGADWQHGLQRLQVDLAARTLVARGLMAPPGTAPQWMSPWNERSLQIGDHLYYLSGGELAGAPW